jgi:hypothetical protein
MARHLFMSIVTAAFGTSFLRRYPDTYKRRGQARSALGDVQGALDDLDKAAKLLAELPGAADVAGGPADCHAGWSGFFLCEWFCV